MECQVKKYKLLYTEYVDGELSTTDITKKYSGRFYTFDSQYTIIDKTQSITNRNSQYLCVLINSSHMVSINGQKLENVKNLVLDESKIVPIPYLYMVEQYLGEMVDSSVETNIEIVNINVISRDQELVEFLSSDFDRYITSFLQYYFPSVIF